MKTVKNALFSAFLLILPSAAISAASRPADYMADVLQALSFCDIAGNHMEEARVYSEKARTNPDHHVNVLKEFHLVDGFLDRAERTLAQYPEDPDKKVAKSAEAVQGAVRLLRLSNQAFINLLSGQKKFESEEQLTAAMAKIAATREEAWDLLTEASLHSAHVLIDTNEEEVKHTGSIPYRISKEEREALIDRVNHLFGDNIRKYREQKAKNPSAEHLIVDKIAFVASYLDSALRANTYEEAALID
jgi:hypothetical protein